MNTISRGFTGRRQGDVKLPPGQYLEHGFPVLQTGPTPPVRTATWTFTITTETGDDPPLGLEAVHRAPVRGHHGRHPLRHPVVEAGDAVAGRLRRHAPRRRDHRRGLRDGQVLRRLHDQPAAARPARRPGLGRLRVRPQAAPARARRPGPAAGPAPVLLEVGQVGDRARPDARPTPAGSGRTSATTTTETRGASSGIRATDLRPPALAGRHHQGGDRRDRDRPHARWWRCRAGPATCPASTRTSG